MKKIIGLALFLNSLSSFGQLVNAESKRIQNDSVRFTAIIEANLNTQKANATRFTTYNLNFTTQLKSKNYLNYYLIFGSYEHTESNTNVITNSSLLHLRYNRKFGKHLRLEAFTQIQHNELLNIDVRNIYGLGTRLKFYSEKLFSMYLGNSYMFEYDKRLNDSDKENYFHRLNNYLAFHLKNKQNTLEINSITYYHPLIKNFKDYRLFHETSLNFKIIKNLFYSTSISLGFDNMPPLGINKNNYTFKNGLKLVL